jgi:hypothetical protein
VSFASSSRWLVLVLALLPSPLAARQATLSGPARVVVGAPLAVAWTGPGVAQDFISVDAPGQPDSGYGAYVYAAQGSPAALTAPEAPGRYVVRYHSGDSGYPVLATHEVEVADTTAVLVLPPSVDAGGQLTLTWTGPAYTSDFISIDATDADDRLYGAYAYTTSSPASIRAPDQAGTYVVRYHLAKTYRVIGRAPLIVGSVAATLTAPAQVAAGGELEVAWSGPGGELDYISIDSVGSPDVEYGAYQYTASGNPTALRVPENPGAYQVRYHMGRSSAVLATIPLEVTPNRATVSGPPAAAGGSRFAVAWTGPDNSGDYVTIVPQGAPNRDYLSYAYTRVGSPATIEAPLEAGTYEIRYMTGVLRDVLASAAIAVTPGVVPGSLRVVADAASPRLGTVEVILDASGSMLQRIDGERRIQIARDALTGLVRDVVPAGTPFVLRVFGHREADSCRTDLEIPLSPLNPASASATIQAVQAMNLARTPIAASLRQVRSDVGGGGGPVLVVLVTDGEETCDDDPMAAIGELRAAGIDVRVNIVGFAIDEHQLRERFGTWARAGGGRYIEARDRAELQRAMAATVESSFEVLRGDDVVATGVVNGATVALSPGAYRVRVLAGSATAEHPVEIGAGEERVVPVG